MGLCAVSRWCEGCRNKGGGGESVSQSSLMYKLFFIPARGNLRSWLPAISPSRAPATPQASAPSTYRRLGRGRDQAIAADGGDARKMVKGLIAANDFLGFRFEGLRAAVSKGY